MLLKEYISLILLLLILIAEYLMKVVVLQSSFFFKNNLTKKKSPKQFKQTHKRIKKKNKMEIHPFRLKPGQVRVLLFVFFVVVLFL